MSSNNYGYFVNSCPLSKEETTKAASRLKCGIDENGRSQYVCVPNQSLTALVEFCYTRTIIGLFQIGHCLIVVGNGFLDQISCKRFTKGCPTEHFRSTDLYKYPACHLLNTEARCFEADPLCDTMTRKTTPSNVQGYFNATRDGNKYFKSTKSAPQHEFVIRGLVFCVTYLLIGLGILFIICYFMRRQKGKESHKFLGSDDEYCDEMDSKTTTKSNPEEKLGILYQNLKTILQSAEYEDILRKGLEESFPEYLQLIEKRWKDLLEEEHGIVIAGATNTLKSRLIDSIIQKEIFGGSNMEPRTYKVKYSEEIIVTEKVNGKPLKMHLQNCNIETESGVNLLRDTLGNTMDTKSRYIRDVEIGIPIPFLKGNGILIDHAKEDISIEAMDFIRNAVSFIFVVDIGRDGGMRKNSLPEFLKEIIDIQIEDEMPCFDPREIIFVINNWDGMNTGEFFENRIRYDEILKDIKANWPSVKEENVFKMCLNQDSTKKTKDSTSHEKFHESLKKTIMKNKTIRISNHLRFFNDFLKKMLLIVNSGLLLCKRSEVAQNELAESHKEKIKELQTECVEVKRTLRCDIKKIIKEAGQEAYEYISSDLGKKRLFNPPGHVSLVGILNVPSMFREHIKKTMEMYIQEVLQSEKIREKFHTVKEKALALYDKVSSEISEMENDWSTDPGTEYAENVETELIFPHMTSIITISPPWIEIIASLTGNKLFFVNIALRKLIESFFLGRRLKMEKAFLINEDLEMCKTTIRSTICTHLESYYGEVFEKLIKKITEEVLPRRIRSLEIIIDEFSINRQRLLSNQVKLQSLSRKIKDIQERKHAIQINNQLSEF